jgi:hypothetical protein
LENKTEGKNRTTKELTLIKTRTKKSHLTLPKEVGDVLRSLPLDQRKAYATALSKAGWTLQSIATELKLTRESIRLYESAKHSPEVLEVVKHLPMPEVPTVEVYAERIKRVEINPKVLAELKELKAKATMVRGKSKKNREEAELYTKLIYETLQSGVSGYRLAKELGVTHSALSFRLVRYGYATSEGKSRTYRKLTHRKEIENA